MSRRAAIAMLLLVAACTQNSPAPTTEPIPAGGPDVVVDIVYAEGFATGTDPGRPGIAG